MDQESVEVGTTCRVKNRQEALHVTGRSRVEIRGWVFVFMWFVMFQGLLHHLFLELLKHVSSVIAREEGIFYRILCEFTSPHIESLFLGGQAFLVPAHVALW